MSDDEEQRKGDRRATERRGIGDGYDRPLAACAECGVAVDLVPSGWNYGDPCYCPAHKPLEGRDPRYVIPAALDAAERDMSQHSEELVRWCLPELHDVFGFILPGTVTYACAFPKNGKTAFVANNIAYWERSGIRPWVMPTESRPKGLMTRLAAARAGVSADDALSRRLRERVDAGDADAIEAYGRLLRAYQQLRDEHRTEGASLAIEPAPRLTRTVFKQSVAAAAAGGFGIVVVDHVDHISSDEGSGLSGYAASEAVQHDALEFAERYELPVVLMSQLNESRVVNDPLAKYRRPQTNWIWMKGVKDQIATSILGIFRPMLPDVDDKVLAAVRSGDMESWKIAMPHTMGIADLASRFGGGKRDRVVHLQYLDGALSSLPGPDLRALEGARDGIDTQHYFYRDAA